MYILSRKNIPLILILFSGFILRFQGINWDQGFHLHPDERAIIMAAEKINFFSNLNPDFFNYGTLPMYLTKGISQLSDFFLMTHFSNYSGLLYVGRTLSVLSDTAVIFFIYLIAKNVFNNQKVAILSSFTYTIVFFTIQNSHFFIVDVFLNLFLTMLLYFSIIYIRLREIRSLIAMGIIFAAALATKITAIIFLPILLLMLLQSNSSFRKRLHLDYGTFLKSGILFTFTLFVFHFLFMPYAYLSFERFYADLILQTKMNSNPYIFPYTLQYVSTAPYLYHLKNIFLWGMGPALSILAFIGILSLMRNCILPMFKKFNLKFLLTQNPELITTIFYLFYFTVLGASAVKFMRYMLPIYPFLAILAGLGMNAVGKKSRTLAMSLIVIAVITTISFMQIYLRFNTRVDATEWIRQNILPGSTIAVEHWDDRLPLIGSDKYLFEELTFYDLPDNNAKWEILNGKLAHSDYIIIASNRLYVPLQKLKDCKKYKVCYPKTAEYYKKLFTEQAGFMKVAEFHTYPSIPILNYPIVDDAADESFTVYDHPKILIFKKMRRSDSVSRVL